MKSNYVRIRRLGQTHNHLESLGSYKSPEACLVESQGVASQLRVQTGFSYVGVAAQVLLRTDEA